MGARNAPWSHPCTGVGRCRGSAWWPSSPPHFWREAWSPRGPGSWGWFRSDPCNKPRQLRLPGPAQGPFPAARAPADKRLAPPHTKATRGHRRLAAQPRHPRKQGSPRERLRRRAVRAGTPAARAPRQLEPAPPPPADRALTPRRRRPGMLRVTAGPVQPLPGTLDRTESRPLAPLSPAGPGHPPPRLPQGTPSAARPPLAIHRVTARPAPLRCRQPPAWRAPPGSRPARAGETAATLPRPLLDAGRDSPARQRLRSLPSDSVVAARHGRAALLRNTQSALPSESAGSGKLSSRHLWIWVLDVTLAFLSVRRPRWDRYEPGLPGGYPDVTR